MATKLGDAYVTVQPDFRGFQEKVAAKLNESLGPAMDRAGKKASQRLSKSIGNDSSLRAAFAPLSRRFQKEGDNLGEQLAKHIGKGAKRAEGDMFGLSGAIKEMEKRSSSASSKAKILANDTFGIAHAARDAGQGYKLLRNATSDWGKDAKRADVIGKRLTRGVSSLARDVLDVARGLKASAGGFGNFEGIMARANRGFQFFRNILGSLKIPAITAGLALLAQSLSALAAGAVATASALGPLSGALIALPALALAGAQAVGTLKLALSGIGDAVKAATAVQVQGGEQAVQTLRQQENAAEAVADAHRTLASAERDAEYATEDLTKARKDATEQLHEMERASRESRLTEQEGSLALREARRELNKTLKEPSSTGFDIRSAEQAVERAKFGLEATREEAKKARKDYAEAQKKGGVSGMPEVVSARRAQADADRSVAAAERGLAKAERDNTDAMKQQGSAATALQQKMAELTPSGRKFAKFLISLKPRYDELREVASKGFFPGAESGIKSALKNFGVFKGIVGETSDALGQLAAKAGSKLGSEAWGRDLGKIGAEDTQIIERLGDAGLNLGDAFRNVLVAAEPLLDWMSEGTVKFSEWLKTSSQAGRETGSLSHFFEETREAMERVWRILKPLGEGLLNVGHVAKGLGNEILDSLGDAAQGWADWTKSTEGQNKLKRYFVEVKPTIWAIGRLVRDMTDDFAELGRQKGPATLIESIRKTLLPLLTNGAGSVTGFVSGFLDRFNELHSKGMPAFDAFVTTLVEHAAEAGWRIAKALVDGFLNASPLSKLVVGGWMLAKFGGVGAIAKLGKYVGSQFGAGVASTAATSVEGGAITKSLGGRLKSGFLSLGKQLGIAMVAYGVTSGVYTAVSESKAAHSIGDALHNFSIGAFRAFGINLGETTAEEFSKGFKGRVETLATTGFIGKQSVITPQIEARATAQAEQQVPAGEGAPGFEEAYERAISNIMRDIQARRASAKELFGSFWQDMGPDEKTFAKALRRALVQGERLVKQTGITLPKVKLETNPAQSAKAAKEILGKFDYLRKGIGNSLHDINQVSKEAGQQIAQTFGKGTKEGRELAARNMKLTADAIGTQMARSGDITKKGVDRIKELIRNANLLAPTKKLAEEFGNEWAKGVGSTKKATSDAVDNIISEARKMPPSMRKIALETWLEQLTQARKSGKLTVEAFRDMRSQVFAEFGVFHKGSKDFNKKVAEGFVGMVNNSGGAMGILMQNLSGLLGTLGDHKKLNWKIIDAKIGKDVNGPSLGRQTGGPVPARAHGGLAATVPGNTTGDRHVLALGGRPVAKVESGEGIFVGNRRMMAAAKAANDAVPRFQTGGVAKRATGGLVEPKLEGNAGPLKQLGQAAIKKVYEGAKSMLGKQRSLGGGASGPLGSMPVGGSVADHPELQPGISAIVATILKKWSGLQITSTTGGGHAENSYHYLGRAADLGASSRSYEFKAAEWIKEKLGGNLTEGIHNPNLSIDGGNEVSPAFWGPETWGEHLTHIHVAKQRGGLLGYLKGFQKGGGVKGIWAGTSIDKTYPTSDGFTGEVVPPYVIQALAEWAGLPGLTMYQITEGESSGHAGMDIPDPPGRSKGLYAINDHYNPQYGSSTEMRNPILNTLAAKGLVGAGLPNANIWHGSSHVTGWDLHYGGDPEAIARHIGGGEGAGSSAAGAGEKTKAAEKPLPNYQGLPTSSVKFGHPKTLDATNRELDRLIGKDGQSGLLKRYRDAAHKADKAKKPATADALRKCAHSIEQRVAGLRKQRRNLRMVEAGKALKRRITGKLSKIEGYDQRVQGAQHLYEEAGEIAEGIIGLEPESPEVGPEPEVPEQAKGESDKAYEKKRRDVHNEYEKGREKTERDYVANFTAYVEGKESPAYQNVLGRIADWRNTILRAETHGFGDGSPSIDGIQRGLEHSAHHKINKIDAINNFTELVGERVQAYWAKVKEDVSNWRSSHQGQDLPEWLKKEQAGLPDWLQGQVNQRDREREQLPFLRTEKTELEEAIGTAREAFFAGGKNRLVDPPTLPRLPLAGSGTFEGYLEEVQGIHPYPALHEILDVGALAPPRDPSRFRGAISSTQEAIEGLGLKIRQTGSSVQKASIEGEGNGGGGEGQDNSEREGILEELLRQANQERIGRRIEEEVFGAGLPFAGTFHSGGTVNVPGGGDAWAHVRDEEHILTPEQMAALSPSGPASDARPEVNVHLHVDRNAGIDTDKLRVEIEDGLGKTERQGARRAGRGLAGAR